MMINSALVIVAIPLNSALNPVVYFIRKKGMRSFFREAIQRGVRSVRSMSTRVSSETRDPGSAI